MKLRRIRFITVIVLAAIMIYASITLIKLNSSIAAALDAKAELRAQVEEKAVSNDKLKYAIEHSGEDATKSDIARDSLGLADPDEKIFYDSGN